MLQKEIRFIASLILLILALVSGANCLVIQYSHNTLAPEVPLIDFISVFSLLVACISIVLFLLMRSLTPNPEVSEKSFVVLFRLFNVKWPEEATQVFIMRAVGGGAGLETMGLTRELHTGDNLGQFLFQQFKDRVLKYADVNPYFQKGVKIVVQNCGLSAPEWDQVLGAENQLRTSLAEASTVPVSLHLIGEKA